MTGRMQRIFAVLFMAAVVVSCGKDASGMSNSQRSPTSAASTSSPEPIASLVGRWKQIHHCDDLVRAFDAAALGAVAPSCKGKHPQLHFHFFTESGQFGSLDKNEQQVDDGTYEIIDAHTFQIGESTFSTTSRAATR